MLHEGDGGNTSCLGEGGLFRAPSVELPPWPSDCLYTQPIQTALPLPHPPTSPPGEAASQAAPVSRMEVEAGLVGQVGELWGQWGGGLVFYLFY